MFGELTFCRIGKEARHVCAACRHCADRKTDCRSSQPWHPRALPVILGHPDRAFDRNNFIVRAQFLGNDCKRFADGKECHRKRGNIDAIEKVRCPHHKTCLSGQLIDADQAKRQADEK